MRFAFVLGLCVLAVPLLSGASITFAADKPAVDFAPLEKHYQADIRPLLKSHCLSCHSTEKSEGELDLERFANIDDVRQQPLAWLKVVEMIDTAEMPPKDAKQLTLDQKKSLLAWIDDFLKTEGRATAGDPGPVGLRRLNNAEYTYTVRDLTGVLLNPAREFPVDGAAGEGFTNAVGALAMSPALFTKYLDAAKEISQHAVLLPDGFRFSNSSTPSDWTNEILADIRELYGRYSDTQGATRVNLQGVVFDTNGGGRLPIEKYFAALLTERQALADGAKTLDAVAKEHKLSAKYLKSVSLLMQSNEPSPVLDLVRQKWRTAASGQLASLVTEIHAWQNELMRFQNVGHMQPWMVPSNPIVAQREQRLKLPASETGQDVTVYFSTGTAGDGNTDDVVVWQQPRIVTPGLPDLMLKDVRAFLREMPARRSRIFAAAKQSLAAASSLEQSKDFVKLADLAAQFDVAPDVLAAWFNYLGLGAETPLKLDLFTKKTGGVAGYQFVRGWEKTDALSILANSSDQAVRIPGEMKPHGVVVHPSPTQTSCVGWLSPVTGNVRVEAVVTHAHAGCGNGVTWALELRRGATRQRLAAGVSNGAKPVPVGPIESLALQQGDLISLLIGPRDGNHACDLTDLEFHVATPELAWSLTKDVSADLQAANPHADGHGNNHVWQFYSEPAAGPANGAVIPTGSLLARWQAANDSAEKAMLADAVQQLLLGSPPADEKHPDAQLYRQLASPSGPLFSHARTEKVSPDAANSPAAKDEPGLDPQLFGKLPNGSAIDANSLGVQAPHLLEFRLPADLLIGSELVATATLAPESAGGSVQVLVTTGPPPDRESLRPNLPILAAENSEPRQRFTKAFDDFRTWFPASLCYPKIVPVDEVVTLTLFHREDERLARLMLDDEERRQLDRLWEELHFVSRDPLTLVDAYLQLMEYATQDRPDLVIAFEVFRKPINDGADKFRAELLAAEPKHLESLIAFAAQAYRRPLSPVELAEFPALYQKLRAEELPHDEAIRFLLARVLVSPKFLYREEAPGNGAEPTSISDWELATRLSYFLWSSPPDERLRQDAAVGKLSNPDELVPIARRMMNHPTKVRRFSTEFGCQWLHIYDFDQLDEKSEKYFPEFAGLRTEMHDEAVRFLTDVFLSESHSSILTLLDANHTYVNEPLAKFYGVDGVTGPDWKRVDNWQARGRGGVLGLAATLAKQSGASRTSPILRGNWVSEVLLGEKLPKPPKGVPPLPDDEAAETLSVRQLTERHTRDERCSNCHQRIDPLGFALERFDAIGRLRDKDLGDRPIDTKTTLRDGTELNGLNGLRKYLAETRRDAFVRQFCRKLLGYALGRGVQLSDEPLLDDMMEQLAKRDYELFVAVESIVRSPQFRTIRGREFVSVEE